MRYLNLIMSFSLLIALSLLSGCTAGTLALNKGERLEAEGKFEEAMYRYADAFQANPTEGEYRIRFLKVREKAANQHFNQGRALAEKGNYIDALAEFQAAYGIDPSQALFKQRVEITTRLKDAQVAYLEGLDFEKANKLKDALRMYTRAMELSPKNSEYRKANERVSGMRKSKLEGFELSLKSTKPITLKFKDAKMKEVFNILTQLTGINFIFDEGVKDTPVSIYLENASFYQAFDLLISMNKLGRKTLNETTVIVYSKTPEKGKQYEDMVMRVFHLNYIDAKKAINLIRTMIQVRKAYVNEDSNSIVVRDTADIVDVVEKILDANDVPDAEVILDVEVIEVSDKNTQNVGLLLSSYSAQLGAFTPEGNALANSLTAVTTTATTAATTTTSNNSINNLLRAFTIQGYGGFVTVPSATYNFGKNLTKGNVLANPKIRVKNKEKSKFNVGTRQPITTTTLNGTLSQVNVQYVDVGVKVNAEPNILLNNEITIKLSLEVSSILSKEKIGDASSLTTVVTIGTRNVETVLSLKDGETSIIGGLIQSASNSDKTKLFLLGDIPLIGPLLSNNNTSKDKTELLLAITPRLVRGVSVPPSGLASFISGKEDDPSLVRPLASFEQEPVFDATTQQKDNEIKPVDPAVATMQKPADVSMVSPPRVTTSDEADPSLTLPATFPTPSPAKTPPDSVESAMPVAPAAPVAPLPKTTMPDISPSPTVPPVAPTPSPAKIPPKPVESAAPAAPVAPLPKVTTPAVKSPSPTVPSVVPTPSPAKVPTKSGESAAPAGSAASAASLPKATTPAAAGTSPKLPAAVPAASPQKTQPNTKAPSTPATPAVAAPIPVPEQRGLLQIAAPPFVTVGQQFSFDIKVNGVAGLAKAHFALSYDPIFVEFVSLSEGPFMKKDGKSTVFDSKAEVDDGNVSVTLSRTPGSGGVSGDGSLVTALFRAKNQGSASFAFRSVGFSGVNGAALTILPFSTAVDIR